MIAQLARYGERPLRFLVAGAINTLFGLAFYPLLLWSVPMLHRRYLLALGISQIVCVCFAFFTYKLGVFRTRGNIAREFSAFSTFYILSCGLNWLALPLLVELGHISPIIAQVGFNLVTILGSFFWHSRVTFAVPAKGG
jgi:putative flippase GtrA